MMLCGPVIDNGSRDAVLISLSPCLLQRGKKVYRTLKYDDGFYNTCSSHFVQIDAASDGWWREDDVDDLFV